VIDVLSYKNIKILRRFKMTHQTVNPTLTASTGTVTGKTTSTKGSVSGTTQPNQRPRG
jgi:hypothetical protein